MNDNGRLRRSLRPARLAADDKTSSIGSSSIEASHRILIVDLNNFSTFPTLAIGLLVASLRNRGNEVKVVCPLAHDVPAITRERQETFRDHVQRRIHLSDWQPFLGVRDALRSVRHWAHERPHPVVLREVAKALVDRPDIVLLSAYLQHFNTVREIACLAAAKGIPVLLGGPMFNLPDVVEVWRKLPGLTAIVGGEVDASLPLMVAAVCSKQDLLQFSGITLPDGTCSAPAQPLRQLDSVPVPDFSDFPWDRYPVRIVPIMSGRGCQWDKCLFCSDVISASGRTFRTRSIETVLLEMQEQARRYNAKDFLFLDLKLNSYPGMIRGIAERLGRYVQGAEWIGTVHVDMRPDNGLSRRDLFEAVAGGMRRVSFGLESGSQRLLDAMSKGSSVEANSTFIRNANDVGLSVRCTMFKGFPGETADDMEATATFLEDHFNFLDRVRFNDFSLQQNTPIFDAVMAKGGTLETLSVRNLNHRSAKAEYRNPAMGTLAYRKAKMRALKAVHQINSRALRPSARQFDGLM